MRFLKALAAFKPSNVKRGLDAARNPPSQAEIEASLASLTPEQRAAYEENMARVRAAQAESRAAWEQAAALSDEARTLGGPAGRHLHGPSMREFGSPDELHERVREQGVFAVVREQRAARRGEFKSALRQTFNRDAVKQIDDPERRRLVAAEERAARDLIRRSYAAPDAVPTAIDRLATRGATQVAEVLAHLRESGLAARPHDVFGVYRVPDRISGPITPQSERGRVVEWDVVRAAGAPPAAGSGDVPLTAASFAADERWVARRLGERSVLDEELAIAYLLAAGVGPEQCLGVARVAEFRELRDNDEDGDMTTLVKGVVAIHPERSADALAPLREAAPLTLAADHLAAAGIHVEVLDWATIAGAVHPRIHHPPPVPSPFPYLPSTPQELLRGYLEIVGVRPADSYGVQATVDRPRALIQGGLMTTNLGPKQPCADGKARMRTRGCEHVVIVYRDRPEYAAGRARWEAYASEILQARLSRDPRATIEVYDELDGVPGVVRPVARAAALLDRFWEWGAEQVVPHRYCWPPIDLAP